MKRNESLKYKTRVRALYKGGANRTLLGRFLTKKEVQTFFELNIGKLPNKTKNNFSFNGEMYHIMYEWI